MSKNNTAYQCNKQYKEIEKPEPLSPHSNVLRVCIEGESNAFKCEKIVSATLKQKDKADKNLITDGESTGEFTTHSSKEQICMLTALVFPEYFVKKSNTDTLTLTVEGSALMPLTSQRRQRRLAAKALRDKNVQLTVEVLPAGQTDLLTGSQGTASDFTTKSTNTGYK